uniref:Secreted protein n=1 Tax=Arundo donax TaxID=35708 RepID=A0A0A9GKA1_ARUDO
MAVLECLIAALLLYYCRHQFIKSNIFFASISSLSNYYIAKYIKKYPNVKLPRVIILAPYVFPRRATTTLGRGRAVVRNMCSERIQAV